MKINYLLLFGLLSTITLVSCGGTESSEQSTTESAENNEESAEPEMKSCQLKSYSFQLGDKSRTLHFKYDGVNLKSLEMTEAGKDETQAMSYTYDESGKLNSFELDKSKATYIYDANGLLTEIQGEGSLNTRTFEYDEEGRMIKQVTMFGGKPYTTHLYSYENNAPSKVELMMKGELYETYALLFDDKKNPLMHKGIFANSAEMMLGYAVANFQHNVVSITTTNKKGEEDKRELTYDYDDNGYPTSEKRKRGDQEIVTVYEYDCE
jgi:YD repeat-containing protein